MSNQDTWIRVPVSLLAHFLDCLNQIDCINAGLITGSINQQVKTGQDAFADFLDKHNANTNNPTVMPDCAAMHFMQNHVANITQETELSKVGEVTHA